MPLDTSRGAKLVKTPTPASEVTLCKTSVAQPPAPQLTARQQRGADKKQAMGARAAVKIAFGLAQENYAKDEIWKRDDAGQARWVEDRISHFKTEFHYALPADGEKSRKLHAALKNGFNTVRTNYKDPTEIPLPLSEEEP